jgi:hypothetical protein
VVAENGRDGALEGGALAAAAATRLRRRVLVWGAAGGAGLSLLHGPPLALPHQGLVAAAHHRGRRRVIPLVLAVPALLHRHSDIKSKNNSEKLPLGGEYGGWVDGPEGTITTISCGLRRRKP